jgi:hypothetical protein
MWQPIAVGFLLSFLFEPEKSGDMILRSNSKLFNQLHSVATPLFKILKYEKSTWVT